MLTSLLAEALSVTSDNLTMAATIVECAEIAAEDMSPEINHTLNLLHVGLSIALQAMEHDELEQLINQGEEAHYKFLDYCPRLFDSQHMSRQFLLGT